MSTVSTDCIFDQEREINYTKSYNKIDFIRKRNNIFCISLREIVSLKKSKIYKFV